MYQYASLAECLARETAALKIAQASAGTQQCLIWSSSPGLAVARRDTRLPSFDIACQVMAGKGFPVAIRDSGGSAVVQSPGIVNLTMVSSLSSDCERNFSSVYDRLTAPILETLRTMDIPATLGSVHGAYCDGEFNIVAFGKKIAGTAQRRVRGAILSHACINLAADDNEVSASINTFYRLAGGTLVCDPLAGTSVEKLLIGNAGDEPPLRQNVIEFCSLLDNTLNKHGLGDVTLNIGHRIRLTAPIGNHDS